MLAGAGIGACHAHIQGKPLGLGTLPFVAVGAFGSTAFFGEKNHSAEKHAVGLVADGKLVGMALSSNAKGTGDGEGQR